MGNIKTWLVDAETRTGEQIEAIVVGVHSNRKPKPFENKIISREEGLAILDRDYDSGHGGAGRRPMYAWSKSRVYFINEYDGATGLGSVPRHPVDVEPKMGG